MAMSDMWRTRRSLSKFHSCETTANAEVTLFPAQFEGEVSAKG